MLLLASRCVGKAGFCAVRAKVEYGIGMIKARYRGLDKNALG
jgi:hypothetical protein